MNTQEIFDTIKLNQMEHLKQLYAANSEIFNTTDEHGLSPLLISVYCGYKDLTDFIASVQPNLNLYEASALGNLKKVRDILREAPCLIDSYSPDGFTPLCLASFFGCLNTAEFLVYTGADVNKASINAMKVTPLHSAVSGRHEKIVKLLLSYGAQVNVPQQGGNYPLHSAACHGHIEIIQLLLECGANKQVVNHFDKTPYDIALENNHLEAADLLIITP